MDVIFSAGFIIVVLMVVVVFTSVRIVQEYERGVIFRLGRCVAKSTRYDTWCSPTST